MKRLKNPDGSPGALVDDSADISKATIISDENSEIKGKTVLIGSFFVFSSKIEDCMLEASMSSEILRSNLKDANIKIGQMSCTDSRLCSLGVDDEPIKSCLEISSSTIDVRDEPRDEDDYTDILLKENSSITIRNSAIRGFCDILVTKGNLDMNSVAIAELKPAYDNASIGLPLANIFVSNKNACINAVSLVGRGKALFSGKGKATIKSSTIRNTVLMHSGVIESSSFDGPFLSNNKVKIKNLKILDKSEISLMGLPSVTCDIKDVVLSDKAMFRNRYSSPVSGCSLVLSKSEFRGNAKIYLSRNTQIVSSRIQDDSIVQNVVMRNTVVKDSALVYGVNLDDCSISGDAVVGYDISTTPVGESDLLFFNGMHVSSALDFQIYKKSSEELIVFNKGWAPLTCKKNSKGYAVQKSIMSMENDIKKLQEKVAKNYPDSPLANDSFDMLEVLATSIKLAEQKYRDVSTDILKNMATYELMEVMKALSKLKPKPKKELLDWLYRFERGAKIDIFSKEIVAYDVHCTFSLIEKAFS